MTDVTTPSDELEPGELVSVAAVTSGPVDELVSEVPESLVTATSASFDKVVSGEVDLSVSVTSEPPDELASDGVESSGVPDSEGAESEEVVVTGADEVAATSVGFAAGVVEAFVLVLLGAAAED